MKIIKRIVAAIDFSVYSPGVFEHAAKIAEQTSAEIVAVNVINERLVKSVEKVFTDQHPGMFSLKKYLDDEIDRRTQSMKDLIREWIPSQIPTRTVIKNGVPFEEIIRVSSDGKADLLIIAPKGRTNLAVHLFGTTSEKIFRHSPVPVLVLNCRDQQ